MQTAPSQVLPWSKQAGQASGSGVWGQEHHVLSKGTDAVYMDLYKRGGGILNLWSQQRFCLDISETRNLNVFCKRTSFPGVEKLVLSYRYFTEFVIGYNHLLQQQNSYELQ